MGVQSTPPAPIAVSNTDVRNALASWKDYRGCNPFGSASSGHAVDRCNEFLANAGAILSMLSAASEDSCTLLNKREDSSFDNRVGTILAGALDGVGNLIELAAFMLDDD